MPIYKCESCKSTVSLNDNHCPSCGSKFLNDGSSVNIKQFAKEHATKGVDGDYPSIVHTALQKITKGEGGPGYCIAITVTGFYNKDGVDQHMVSDRRSVALDRLMRDIWDTGSHSEDEYGFEDFKVAKEIKYRQPTENQSMTEELYLIDDKGVQTAYEEVKKLLATDNPTESALLSIIEKYLDDSEEDMDFNGVKSSNWEFIG